MHILIPEKTFVRDDTLRFKGDLTSYIEEGDTVQIELVYTVPITSYVIGTNTFKIKEWYKTETYTEIQFGFSSYVRKMLTHGYIKRIVVLPRSYKMDTVTESIKNIEHQISELKKRIACTHLEKVTVRVKCPNCLKFMIPDFKRAATEKDLSEYHASRWGVYECHACDTEFLI